MSTGETVFWTLMVILTPISVGAFLAVAWWIVRQQGEKESTERVDKIWGYRGQWGEPICRQLINREVTEGMTPEMVRLAWGEPKAIEQRATGGEQWVYDTNSSDQTEHYAILKEGRVIQAKNQAPQTGFRWGPWWIIWISLGLSFLVSVIALVIVFVSG